MPIQTTFMVANGTDLDNAITAIDAGGADAAPDTAYTIDVTAPISLDADPLAVDLDSGSSLTIAGSDGTGSAQAETLGDGSEAGLVVSAGTVTVESLTIANAVVQGGTLVLGVGAKASGTVIQEGGTLDLQAGGVLAGSVAFAGGGTLQIDGTTMPAATISGFGTSGTIDLTGIAFDPAGSAVLTSGNVLQISEGGETVALQLDPTQDFSEHGFALASDGHGGTTMVDPGLTTVVNFTVTNGANPHAPLLLDAAGDLFGTTYAGGASSDGTVFELVKTGTGYASSPSTLVSFNGTDGALPYGGLIADAAGDLFGVTQSGTVYEIVKTGTGYAATPTVLVSFNGTDGASPEGELLADPAGDLFGVTQQGGAYNDGTVFEIAKTAGGYASTPTVLVSFNGTDGADPTRPLIFDRFYDLFSTTQQGGAYNDGTVFEIANTNPNLFGPSGYTSTPTTLVSFNGADGAAPASGVIMDTAGDLFGTTAEGGASSNGTVFEIANTIPGLTPGRYASTPTVLVSFNGGYSDPLSGLIADAAGDLFGTTTNLAAGDDGNGTVFEITKTASGYTSAPLLIDGFSGTNGAVPDGTPLIVDSNGNLFGTTYYGGYGYAGGLSGDGTVFEDSNGPVLFRLPPSEMVGGPYSGNESSSFGSSIALNLSLSNGVNNPDVLTTVLSVPSGIIQVGGISGVSGNDTSTVTLRGTAAQINADLAVTDFFPNSPPNLNVYGQFTLTMTTSDTNAQASATAQINVADTATITESGVTGGFSGNENSPISLGAISVSDSNTGDASLVTTLQVMDGTITVGTTTGGAKVGGSGSGTVTLAGTAAQIDASLKNTSYTGSSNFYGNDTLSVTSTDGGGRSSGTSIGTITVNAADTTVPSVSAGGPYSGNENTAIPIGGVNLGASPNASDPLSVTLRVADGTLSAGGQSGVTITLSGTAAQITTALSGTTYTGSSNFYGNDTLSVTATDTVDQNQATGSATINVADTTAPSVSAGGPYSGNENALIALNNISLSASPNAGDALSLTLSVADGTLGAGGQSGASVTLTGTAAQITTALSTASYTGNLNYYGPDTLSVTATDTQDGNATATKTAAITVNDTSVPSEVVPSTLSGSENAAISLGGVSVSVSPNAGDPLSTVLSVSHGTITAGGQTGASVKLSGTATAINTALSTASYTGNSNYYGPDTLSVTTADTQDGNATATKTAAITVNPILPTAGNAQLFIAPGQSVDLTNPLLALDRPGLPADMLALTGATGNAKFSNGDVSYTAPKTGISDSFNYTVTDKTLGTSAIGTVGVTLNQSLAGNDTITLSGSDDIVAGGNGNDNVSLTGNNNAVIVGNGNDTVTVGGTGDSITAGTGNDIFNLDASMTTLTMHGQHDTVSVNGGSDTITDTLGGSDKLQLNIGGQGGTVGITNFGVANAVVSLVQALAGAEHWTSPAQIAAAVTSDNHGASLLNLGSHGSIDFVGVPTGKLTANNFRIS